MFRRLTVIIALVASSVTNIPSITVMGSPERFSVLIASSWHSPTARAAPDPRHRALTRRERKRLAAGAPAVGENRRRGIPGARRTFLHGWVTFVTRRPWISLIGSVVMLLVVAAPIVTMKTASNVPGGDDPTSTETQGVRTHRRRVRRDAVPAAVLVRGEHVADRLSAGRADCRPSTTCRTSSPGRSTPPATAAVVTVIPDGGPIDAGNPAAVHDIRDTTAHAAGLRIDVTGETAIGVDSDAQMHRALIEYIAVIVVLSFLPAES